MGQRFPTGTGRKHSGRKGLADPGAWLFSGENADDKYLVASIDNSSLEQVITVYSAAGIEEFEKDISLMDLLDLQSLIAKLTNSEEELAKELKKLCVEKIKNNPEFISYIVENQIVTGLINALYLVVNKKDENGEFIINKDGAKACFLMPEEDKSEYLNSIKDTIELYSIEPKQISDQILDNILNGQGIQYMNSGTAKYDVERFIKLIEYLEKVTGYIPDMNKVKESILEKAISKYLPEDGLYGLPLTEDVNYLAQLPELLGLKLEKLKFIKRYAETGKFNLVIITTLNRAIHTGGGLLGGYNTENMTKFCKLYQKYINFDDSNIVTLIDILKSRDETKELSNYSPKEILLDERLGELLYEQVGKYGSPGDKELLENIKALTGNSSFTE